MIRCSCDMYVYIKCLENVSLASIPHTDAVVYTANTTFKPQCARVDEISPLASGPPTMPKPTSRCPEGHADYLQTCKAKNVMVGASEIQWPQTKRLIMPLFFAKGTF